ncbi:MAG: Ig-like domain-containing domain [Chitinophagales bacterium]|nr:Ig-like domain-containing domain [Chitinophagales bacterium]
MMKKTKLLAFSCWLLASCANIVAPTGGPKDEQPPKIVGESSANYSTRFTGNTIAIEFDEYVQLNNPSQEIVISPAIEPEPKFSIKGKRLTIEFKGTLDSATTYTIAFGEALKDANESNTLSGFKYVFSTGEELDSLFVKGKVTIAKSDNPADKVLVMLYKETTDSIVFQKKPFYFTKTDSEGRFSLENIRVGEYKIFALKDENFNYLYDLPNEEIAFAELPIRVDSSNAPIPLFLFKEDRKQPLKVLSKDDSKQECFKMILSGKAESVELFALNNTIPAGITEYNATRDSVTVWYTRPWKAETARLLLNNEIADTFSVRSAITGRDSLKNKLSELTLLSRRETYHPADKIFVLLNRPAQSADFTNIMLEQDSPQIELKYNLIHFTDSVQRKIEIDFIRKPGTAYTVRFPKGTFKDYFGLTNDSLEWNVVTKKQEDFASLKLTVSGNENTNYILQLLGDNESVAIEKIFSGKAVFQFNDLLPGSYQPLLIYDTNKNGKWDAGDYILKAQPEKTYRHPEPINLRANWEMEVELRLASSEQ